MHLGAYRRGTCVSDVVPCFGVNGFAFQDTASEVVGFLLSLGRTPPTNKLQERRRTPIFVCWYLFVCLLIGLHIELFLYPLVMHTFSRVGFFGVDYVLNY